MQMQETGNVSSYEYILDFAAFQVWWTLTWEYISREDVWPIGHLYATALSLSCIERTQTLKWSRLYIFSFCIYYLLYVKFVFLKKGCQSYHDCCSVRRNSRTRSLVWPRHKSVDYIYTQIRYFLEQSEAYFWQTFLYTWTIAGQQVDQHLSSFRMWIGIHQRLWILSVRSSLLSSLSHCT